MIIKMPDASVIIRQRLANAVIGGLISSNKTHSTMASIQKKLKIYGDAYGTSETVSGVVYTLAQSNCAFQLDPPTGTLQQDGSFVVGDGQSLSVFSPSEVFPVSSSVTVTSNNNVFYNSSNITYYFIETANCYITIPPMKYVILSNFNPSITYSFTTTQPQPPAPSLIQIIRFSIRYDGSINGGLDYYDFSTYPTLPTEVYVIEVTSITDNIDGTEFTTSGTGNVDNYDSYWFTSTPSQSDIRTCMEDAYSSPVTLPASVIAVKAADSPDWIVNPPSSPPETIFVLVLPYGNNGTSFDLIVKKSEFTITRSNLAYETATTLDILYYDYTTYPTLPPQVRVITVANITGNVDDTEFTTSASSNDYQSYWFLDTPTVDEIKTCMADAYTNTMIIPSTTIAVRSSGATNWTKPPPNTSYSTVYILILPYDNKNGSDITTFTLTVKNRNNV